LVAGIGLVFVFLKSQVLKWSKIHLRKSLANPEQFGGCAILGVRKESRPNAAGAYLGGLEVVCVVSAQFTSLGDKPIALKEGGN
jgi:hypothetical protein